ncbi:MAG: hypothetical protein QXN16_02155 [Candidatus Micrarchaeaceae archaeon]
MGIREWFKQKPKEAETEEELSPIVTNAWINVYFKISYKPPKELTEEQALKEAINFKLMLMKMYSGLRQVVVGERIRGYINPVIGKNNLVTGITRGRFYVISNMQVDRGRFYVISNMQVDKETFNESGTNKEMFLEPISRNFTFKEEKVKDGYDIIVRPVGKSPVDMELIYLKNYERKYGYSPIDFINDKFKLVEFDKEICSYFGIKQLELSTERETAIDKKDDAMPSFNDDGEPIVRARLGTVLFMDYRVSDRLELEKKNPKIARACFGGKDFNNFIDFWLEHKGDNKYIEKWLKTVEKILGKYNSD